MTTDRQVSDALSVLILTPEIRTFLEARDPDALNQALRAVKTADQDPEFDLVVTDPSARAKLGL